jgi:hypothetical protein
MKLIQHQATHKNNHESTVNSDSRPPNKNENTIEWQPWQLLNIFTAKKEIDMSNSTDTSTTLVTGYLNAVTTHDDMPYLSSETVAYSPDSVSGSQGARKLQLKFKKGTPPGEYKFDEGNFTEGRLWRGNPGPGIINSQFIVTRGNLTLTETSLHKVTGSFNIKLAGTQDPEEKIELKGTFDIQDI